MPRLRPSRRVAALALALVASAGLSLASASQLSINGSTLQAGTAVVAACQPTSSPVGVTFVTTYSASAPVGFVATKVAFSGLDPACGGLSVRARVLDTGGAPLGAELTGAVPTGGGSLVLVIPTTAVASIAAVSAVISG